MKVFIENFGPVKKFEFDTENSFHLIVGNNNVGKSYALSAYYAVFKTVMDLGANIGPGLDLENYIIDSMRASSEEKLEKKFPIESKAGDIKVNAFFLAYLKEFLQEAFVLRFSDYIKGTYNDSKSIANKYSQEKVKILIDFGGLSFSVGGDIDGFKVVDVYYEHDVVVRRIKQSRSSTLKNNKLIVYKNISKDESGPVYNVVGRECLKQISLSLRNVLKSYSDIHYLPASRSGLYQALSAFGQIIAELSKSRSFLSKKIELPGISQQLGDYFIKLSNITTRRQGANEEVENIARKVETTVLNGDIEFDSKEKKLFYKPHNAKELRLDLSATSSMVSEVGPIVAYIRHILSRPPGSRVIGGYNRAIFRRYYGKGKQILIIEEPEAHLHPVNQIAMTQLYSELSKQGINIIITSHSNYVFNKLSNLVIAKELDVSDVRCDYFSMTPHGSVGENLDIDELGIDDKNFVDASESLFNEKMTLIEQMDHNDD